MEKEIKEAIIEKITEITEIKKVNELVKTYKENDIYPQAVVSFESWNAENYETNSDINTLYYYIKVYNKDNLKDPDATEYALIDLKNLIKNKLYENKLFNENIQDLTIQEWDIEDFDNIWQNKTINIYLKIITKPEIYGN